MVYRSTPPLLELLREHWTDIQDDLIAAIDVDYGVYDGRTFKVRSVRSLLNTDTAFHGLGWKAARWICPAIRSGRWRRVTR